MAPGQKNDCFLCNFFPFLRTVFPASETRDIFEPQTREVSRSAASSVASGLSNITIPDHEAEDLDKTNMDFAKADFRGFVFAIHPDHGYVLLHCTRKKKKPHHFQLPGGHIDAFEFEAAAKATSDPMQQLMMAGKLGTSRELFEETGMDLRNSLDRLEPAQLYGKQKKEKLGNEYKSRLFYTVQLTDDDFLKGENMSISEAAFLQKAMGAQPPDLKLKLSHEHQGFAFEKQPDVASTLLQHHSGGKVSAALRMSTAVQESQKR